MELKEKEMKTLHIHIGTPKTATTAIQNFCVENAEELRKEGYCYELLPYTYEGVAKVRNAHFLIGAVRDGSGKRRKDLEEQRFAEGMQLVHKMFDKCDQVILSDEDIWRFMDEGREHIWPALKEEAQKGGFSIHVIVYLRRQDEFLSSNWNQIIKKRVGNFYASPFEEYVEGINKKVRLEYYEKLERVAKVVGKEQITVRVFAPGKLEGGTIYADFLAAIGTSMKETYQISNAVRNIGLYGNTHEIKRILNGLPQMEEAGAHRFIMQNLMDFSKLSEKEYPNTMFSAKEAEAFLARYADCNRKVAEEYLGAPGTELFERPEDDLPKWEKENPYMMDDLIRFVGLTGIALHQENQEIRQSIKDIKKMMFSVRHPIRAVFKLFRRLRSGK